MGFAWDPGQSPVQTIPQMYDAYTKGVFQSGRQIAFEQAEAMENYAKANAPWQDQTGDARERLHATVEETGPIGTIVLSHGVDYGLWLELKGYGIIAETIDVFGPIVMRSLQNMMNLGLISRG